MSLIVIEGLDGSGKATQTKLLCDALENRGKRPLHISFPDYQSESSALIRMYLSGAFGEDPEAVNPYAASVFYAADRYASYVRVWKDEYRAGRLIVADRYATSNIIYQSEKLPAEKREEFYGWVSELEYGKLEIPEPELVIYLDMDPEISQRLLLERYQGDGAKKDIHEKDTAFLFACRKNALHAAEKLGWRVVTCYEGKSPLPQDKIHEEIMKIVSEVL